jgi:hypothetical protein
VPPCHLNCSDVPALRGLIGMRDIAKGVSGASGIKLVIYIMKILYFNHRTSFLSNYFGRGRRTNYDHPLQTPASAPPTVIPGRKILRSRPGTAKSIARVDDVAKVAGSFYTRANFPQHDARRRAACRS